MGNVIQLVRPILVGVASFAIARLLRIQPTVAILIGIGTSIVTFVSNTLDFTKKVLEVWKLRGEIRKARREEKEADELKRKQDRIVQLATPDEIQKYGVSLVERKLEIYTQLEAEKERFEARTFVARSHEWKLK